MVEYIVKTGTERKIIRDFLKLPSKLYDKQTCPQDKQLEKQIILGKHVLSKYIETQLFVVYKNREIVSRCLTFFYENDQNMYVGFFESYNNSDAVKALFNKLESYARQINMKAIVGPVNASFWIGYRFKEYSDRDYNRTYTCEPYNKQYYISLWEQSGFKVTDRYRSNFYREVYDGDSSEKCKNRLQRMIDKGYEIKESSFKNFDTDLKEIYRLITALYKTFPIYKHIEYEEFKELFKSLKYILNYSMVKLAYKDKEVVGFFICIPNYEYNTLGKITLRKMINILKTRKNPREYVMLYMGVDKNHLGLGSALAEDTKQTLYKNECRSIGALIHKGKVTGSYYKELITGDTSYVLFKKDITN